MRTIRSGEIFTRKCRRQQNFDSDPVCKESSVLYSPGLVDFAIRLVNSVVNLPDGQVRSFEQFEQQNNYEINSARQKASGAS